MPPRTDRPDDEVVLHADSICRSHGGRRVLTAATLVLRRGTVTVLLGRMGTGKSTMLRICAGALGFDGGWIRFGGRQHFRTRQHELARLGLHYLSDRDNILPVVKLGTQLRIAARRFGAEAHLDEAIDRLQLGALLDRAPVKLSGGERRRAELALAMLRDPACLLADEPFRGLDPLTSDLIGRVLRYLALRGTAVLVTGHEVGALVPWGDEIVWMTSGTTHPLGTPARAWMDHAFRREYLGAELARAGAPVRPGDQQPA